MRFTRLLMGSVVLLFAAAAQAQNGDTELRHRTATQKVDTGLRHRTATQDFDTGLRHATAAQNVDTGLGDRLRGAGVPAPVSTRLTAEEVKQLDTNAAAGSTVAVARGRSVAYMLAGAALFVGGALIGGDAGTLLMIGGVGFGAYGIYLHFR